MFYSKFSEYKPKPTSQDKKLGRFFEEVEMIIEHLSDADYESDEKTEENAGIIESSSDSVESDIDETLKNYTDSEKTYKVFSWYSELLLKEFSSENSRIMGNFLYIFSFDKSETDDSVPRVIENLILNIGMERVELLKAYTIIALFNRSKKYAAYSEKMAAAMISVYVACDLITSFEEFYADILEISVKYGIYRSDAFCTLVTSSE